MGLRNLGVKLKGIRLRKFLIEYGGFRKSWMKKHEREAKWLNHVSHGYRVLVARHHENAVTPGFDGDSSVVVEREQSQEYELWFFGVFDDGGFGEGITKYMQSHFFHDLPPQSVIEKQSKEAIRKAHENTRSKTGRRGEDETGGWASAMVINGEKLVMGSMGGYRAVACINGLPFQFGIAKFWHKTRHSSLKFISSKLRLLGVTSFNWNKYGGQPRTGSEFIVGCERIDSNTEFVLLASAGVWEVMKEQEALNLIRHIEDPQEAAECLATEASTRMARATISCLVIRFD